MPVRRFVQRLLLAMLLCLNGSGALWASTDMMLAAAVAGVDATSTERAAGTGPHGQHGERDTAQTPADHAHEGDDCQCGIGMRGGCGCSCAYPAGCISVGVPFSAHHVLPAAAPAYIQIPAPQRPSGKIFRPPIS
ncbi:MAG: CopL family metal-binding regulatory protein [Luteimonas sp.]